MSNKKGAYEIIFGSSRKKNQLAMQRLIANACTVFRKIKSHAQTHTILTIAYKLWFNEFVINANGSLSIDQRASLSIASRSV